MFYGENTGAILVPITNFKLPGNAAVGLEPRCGFSHFAAFQLEPLLLDPARIMTRVPMSKSAH